MNKSANKKTCATPGCTDPVRSLGFCQSCYAFLKYWEYRPLEERLAHASKLRKAAKRNRSRIINAISPMIRRQAS